MKKITYIATLLFLLLYCIPSNTTFAISGREDEAVCGRATRASNWGVPTSAWLPLCFNDTDIDIFIDIDNLWALEQAARLWANIVIDYDYYAYKEYASYPNFVEAAINFDKIIFPPKDARTIENMQQAYSNLRAMRDIFSTITDFLEALANADVTKNITYITGFWEELNKLMLVLGEDFITIMADSNKVDILIKNIDILNADNLEDVLSWAAAQKRLENIEKVINAIVPNFDSESHKVLIFNISKLSWKYTMSYDAEASIWDVSTEIADNNRIIATKNLVKSSVKVLPNTFSIGGVNYIVVSIDTFVDSENATLLLLVQTSGNWKISRNPNLMIWVVY